MVVCDPSVKGIIPMTKRALLYSYPTIHYPITINVSPTCSSCFVFYLQNHSPIPACHVLPRPNCLLTQPNTSSLDSPAHFPQYYLFLCAFSKELKIQLEIHYVVTTVYLVAVLSFAVVHDLGHDKPYILQNLFIPGASIPMKKLIFEGLVTQNIDLF